MATPKFTPVAPDSRSRGYASPDSVPDAWLPNRPGEIAGFAPVGPRRGNPGPDQGFALKIARRIAPSLHVGDNEHVDDVVRGCLGVALRRASLFSRAPTVHDVRIAFTIWGYLDEQPPAELVELRRGMFAGLRHVGHHYTEAREVVDLVPEATLTMTRDEVDEAYPSRWRELLGV